MQDIAAPAPMPSSSPYRAISLFSGAMGFDIGMMAAGIDVAVSQDFDKWCVETIRYNGHVGVHGDINTLLDADPSCNFLMEAGGLTPGEVFVVIGGPPCQSFSTAGKRLGVKDKRGSLWERFAQVIETVRPRFFVMENVKGLASMPSDPDVADSPPLLDVILARFAASGYSTIHGVLDAVHYGTPQFRERMVVVGSRDNEPVFLPQPTHFQRHQAAAMRWRTLREAVSGLDGEVGLCASFTPKTQDYMKMVPEGGNWRSLPADVQREAMGGAYESGGGKVGFYRRLNFDEPSPTLTTSPVQKSTLLGHPSEARPLSVREYARIQAFPDTWQFQGAAANCYRQIGNAVPIPLGRAIGEMLVAVAEGTATIRTKRTRGTSVHAAMQVAS